MIATMSAQNANSSVYVTISPPPFRGGSVRRCGAPQGHGAKIIIRDLVPFLTSIEITFYKTENRLAMAGRM